MGSNLHVSKIKTYSNKLKDGTEDFSYYWVLMDDRHGLTHPLGVYSDYDIKKLIKSIEDGNKETEV